jgi:hypothetical protein
LGTERAAAVFAANQVQAKARVILPRTVDCSQLVSSTVDLNVNRIVVASGMLLMHPFKLMFGRLGSVG